MPPHEGASTSGDALANPASQPMQWGSDARDVVRAAQGRAHRHDHRFGLIEMTMQFRAFGDSMDTDDVLGNEFTDVYLNEWNTLPEDLAIALGDRVGRDPPFEISGRVGRFFGDCNAPSVTEYVYRDFWEDPKAHHVLYRQPGG
jgi:hypothetical protein